MPNAISGLAPANLRTIATATVTWLLMLSAGAFANDEITGVWLDDSGKGAIELRACDKSICGYIVWLKKATGRDGGPLRDRLNPKQSRQNRPICGLQVIGRLKQQEDGSWDKGWIYDPKQGKSFDVEIRRMSANGLQVKGYLGMKFLSETFMWRRVEGDFVRCKAS